MKEIIKKIWLGWLIWVIPFFISILVWDIELNVPKISPNMFNALMSVCLIVGLCIALYIYLKDRHKRNFKNCLFIGCIWYVELLILDLIVLVNGFGMSWADYYVLFLGYSPVIIVSGFVGYLVES